MSLAEASGRVDLAHEADFRLGAIRVRPSVREVWVQGAREQLEPRIMQVLVVLARSRGATVSRDDLIGCCWEGRIVGEDAINRVIAKLRRLSEQDGGASFTIETIPRVGYRLWSPEPETAAGSTEAAAPGLEPRRRRPPWRWVMAAALLVLLGLGAVLLANWSAGGGGGQASLVVLPFRDISRGGDQTYFAEGVAEEIQSVLAADPGIRVIGRTSARRFKDDADMAAIRSALRVTHVLEGSVGSQPGAVRINVRLLRASDGAQIWAEQYDRRIDDIFAVQDEIGASVALRLRQALGPRPRERPGTALAATPAGEVGAYDLYLAARAHMRERTPEALGEAQALLERAIKRDPDYAPAYAALAETRALLARRMDPAAGARALAEARTLAQRAVTLAPERADGYAALGQVERTEAPYRAVAPLERAARLDPSRSDVRVWLGLAYIAQGRYEDGLREMRAAYAVDPLWRNANANLVEVLARFGRVDEAREVIARWEANANDPAMLAELRAVVAFETGDLSEALRQYRLADGAGRPSGYYLAWTYSALRLFDQARAHLEPGEQSLQALLFVRDVEGLRRSVREDGAGLYTVVGEALRAAMLLNASGRWQETLDLYRRRFPTPAEFCAWSRASPEAAAPFAYALVKAGDRASAEAILSCNLATAQRWAGTGFMRPYNEIELAQMQALLGQRGAALAGIERAVDAGWTGQHTTLSSLRAMPAFETLFDEPRFRAAETRVETTLLREQREALSL